MIYLILFWLFFKIGLFTFGGGYAMIPMMRTELVKAGFMTLEELNNFLAISEATPGAFAINVATFTGFNQAGVLGAVCATLGVISPSIIIIIIIAKIFVNFNENRYVQNVLKGIRPVVVGLIAAVSISLFYTLLLPSGFDDLASWVWQPLVIIPLVLFLRLKFKKLNPIFIIIISAGLGMLLYSI
ncbi:MAG: chromate transporter [Bacilli bacterium]|jgi:chromate transporter